MKDSFCSSPWFHIRIDYDGYFILCRWTSTGERKTRHNIKNCSIMEFYNSDEMKAFRANFLKGNASSLCNKCYHEDKFNKLSGRKKQLLKSAITVDNFDLTLRSSPHYNMFKHSYENDGHSQYMPVDLQINLGNICNSSCIMCPPISSSRIEAEYTKLHEIEPTLFSKPPRYKSWTHDPQLLDRVVQEISQLTHLKYIHFLGGETLYDPAFYKLCDKIIESGLAKNIIIGATTNGTIYTDKIKNYIDTFKEFHLGISIESVTPLNDYIRYGGRVDNITENIKKFCELERNTSLFVNVQISPNVFSVSELDLLFEFMIEHNLTIESGDILTEPSVLRMELMPKDIREEIITKLKNLIDKHALTENKKENTRNRNYKQQVIANNILEYYTFLKDYKVPDNAEEERYKLVRFIKSFEKLHKNRITEYAPRYAEFLSHYGY
jgi:MoaA/NifB/PqqE/SkfB family radical SAM enzyme